MDEEVMIHTQGKNSDMKKRGTLAIYNNMGGP